MKLFPTLMVLGVVWSVSPQLAWTDSCYTVNFINHSKYQTTAVFNAKGCAKSYSDSHSNESWFEVCQHVDVGPGEWVSYGFLWGTTGTSIGVAYWDAFYGDGRHTDFQYYPANYYADKVGSGLNSAAPPCGSDTTFVFDNYWADGSGYNQNDPDLGYIYAYGGTKCMQAASGNFVNGNDIHMWGGCSNGSPQKNRIWQFSGNKIVNVNDRSFCMHKHTSGFAEGDNIHMWDCNAGSDENKTWTHNTGDWLVRNAVNPNFCIVRDGNDNGSAIVLRTCNANDTNHQWKITTWNNAGSSPY